MMKMAKGLHFSTDKFFSAIDAKEFWYTFGNSDIIGELIDRIGTRFGIIRNNVLRAFIHDNQKVLLTIVTKRSSICPINPQI